MSVIILMRQFKFKFANKFNNMEFCGEIQSFLEEENSITIRWISNMLRITISDVLKLVLKNKEAIQKIASFSYLLTRIDNDGNMSYTVAHESEVDNIPSSLCNIQPETIYAMHRLHSSSYKNELFSLECDQATEILSMIHPSSEFFLSNSIGFITCIGNAIQIRPIGQRILQQSKNKQIVNTIIVNEKIEAFTSIQTSVSKVLAIREKQPESTSIVRKSKSSIEASSYFTKGPSASTSLSSSVSVNAKDTLGKDASTLKLKEVDPTITSSSLMQFDSIHETNHSNDDLTSPKVVEEKHDDKRGGEGNCDDDDEWESDYKPDPKKLKEINKNMILSKRKALQEALKLPCVEEEHHDDNSCHVIDSNDNDLGEEKKHSQSNKRSTAHIHGAMDSYMEDIAIAEYKQQQQQVDGSSSLQLQQQGMIKSKKRKLVEKVFLISGGSIDTALYLLYSLMCVCILQSLLIYDELLYIYTVHYRT